MASGTPPPHRPRAHSLDSFFPSSQKPDRSLLNRIKFLEEALQRSQNKNQILSRIIIQAEQMDIRQQEEMLDSHQVAQMIIRRQEKLDSHSGERKEAPSPSEQG